MVVISWRSVRIEYSCVKQNVIRMYAELWITSFEKMENDVDCEVASVSLLLLSFPVMCVH